MSRRLHLSKTMAGIIVLLSISFCFGQENLSVETANADSNISLPIQLNELIVKAVESGKLVDVAASYYKGADINQKDKYGVTPLHVAAGKGLIDIVKFLVKNGADIQARDYEGRSAIFYALTEGHNDVAAFLRDYPGPAVSNQIGNIAEQPPNQSPTSVPAKSIGPRIFFGVIAIISGVVAGIVTIDDSQKVFTYSVPGAAGRTTTVSFANKWGTGHTVFITLSIGVIAAGIASLCE